jgi:hypothetical protein
MKYFISRISPFLLALIFMGACSGDQTSDTSSDNGETLEMKKSTVDSEENVSELADEEINQMRDSVEKVKTAISPFLNKGCCREEDRKTESCCCEAVYEAYKFMLEEGNDNAVDIGMTDPILANCRKLMPSDFDKLENPPSAEPDELDDLFN